MDLLLNDFDNFSDSSSYEDQDEAEFMYGGQAGNILSSLEETIGKIDDFLSFERGFMHGDIICSIEDPSGQTGRVVNVDMVVDLESIEGKKIENVNSKKLKKIRSISLGDYVVYGPWLGKVDKVVDEVTILFDDGRKCEYVGPDKIIPISPDTLEDSQYPYYPGQRVKVDLSFGKSSRRLCGKWNGKQDEGTICAVNAGLVYVDWLACALVGGEKVHPPQRLQDSRNLTVMACFPRANWQLGDWCMLKNSQEIFVISRTRTKVDVIWQDGTQSFALDSHSLIPVNITDVHDFWLDQFVTEKGNGVDQREQKWGVVRCVDAKERTVKVKWESFGVNQEVEFLEESVMSAYELIEHPDYSYCFGDVVFRFQKGPFIDLPDEKDNLKSYLSCIGIVVGFEHGRVKVQWSTGIITKVAPNEIFRLNKYEDMPPTQLLDEEMNEHENQDLARKTLLETNIDNQDTQTTCLWIPPSFSLTGFFTSIASSMFGSIFFTSLDTCENGQKSEISCEDEERELQNLCTGAQLLENFDLPKNEEVKASKENQEMFKQFDMVSGCLDHHFVDGAGKGLMPSQVAPNEIFRLNKYEDMPPTQLLDEEMNEHENQDLARKTLLETNIDNQDTQTTCLWIPPSFSLTGFFTSIASSMFGSIFFTSLDTCENGQKSEISCEDEERELQNLCTGAQLLENFDLPKNEEVKASKENQEMFKQFDMVSGCLDHHFVDGAGKGLMPSQVKRGWLKKVQQEWSTLANNLPETIYVRIYEERMDLIRAAIVGVPGTPYHDGLFVFDIFLPPNYPHEPPLVHYNSGGLRVNPNLYESGKVCLSLLNTWTGTGTETWNPENSNILQVLLSLQALVLNEKPYFNEAGYDKQLGKAEGEKNSVSYNENTLLVSLKSMVYLMRKPPQHFEGLVEEHFGRRSENILMACKAYMEGVPVGCAFGDKHNEENKNQSSTGFKIMLGKLLPMLVETFTDKGIDCSKYI